MHDRKIVVVRKMWENVMKRNSQGQLTLCFLAVHQNYVENVNLPKKIKKQLLIKNIIWCLILKNIFQITGIYKVYFL